MNTTVRLRPNWPLAATWFAFTVVEIVALWSTLHLWTLALALAGVLLGVYLTIRAWRSDSSGA